MNGVSAMGRRVRQAAAVASVAVYAATLLEEPQAAQPFLDDLAWALRDLGRPPPPPAPPAPAAEPYEAPRAHERREEAAYRPMPSAWDPDPVDAVLEASRARALLLELIRRAAHDWVLYRTSRRMEQQELAESAYIWLFEEKPGHPWDIQRRAEKMELTGFLSICMLLDLDPAFVRKRVRQMTPKGIKMAGRPAEHRRRHGSIETDYYVEHGVELVSLEELDHLNTSS